MRFLLLSCCAPCSCAVIKLLAEEGQDFAVVFYNPNIRPEQEYRKRADENKRLCTLYDVPFIELEYDNERWCKLTAGLENEPERGKRCDVCFYMRLKRVMEYAKDNGFEAVASVLGVSRYKDLAQVNRAAAKASALATRIWRRLTARQPKPLPRLEFLIWKLRAEKADAKSYVPNSLKSLRFIIKHIADASLVNSGEAIFLAQFFAKISEELPLP